MLTGELKNKIDTVWNAFWTGGIANPLEVIEQITDVAPQGPDQVFDEPRTLRLFEVIEEINRSAVA